MKGKKEIEETVRGLKNGRSVTTTTFKKIPFKNAFIHNCSLCNSYDLEQAFN